MRISTSLMQQLGINAITDQQSRLSKTQLQLATGKRITTAADDPNATSAILTLKQSLETTEQYQNNADMGISRLNIEETTLRGSIDILQRIRELAIQGNNDSQSIESRHSIALEMRELLDEMIGIANTRDQNGDYIYAGNQVKAQPFSRLSTGAYNYQGDEGQRNIQIGSGKQVAVGDHGKGVFMEIRNGNGVFVTEADTANTGTGIIGPGSVNGTFVPDVNGYELSFSQPIVDGPITYNVRDNGGAGAIIATGTYSSGASITFNGAVVGVEGVPADGDIFTINISRNQNIFQTIDNLATALESSSTSPSSIALFHNQVGRAITDIDRGLENIESYRSKVGARLNTIDQQKSINDTITLQLNSAISNLQDLDYAEAISRLNLEMVGLQAAQQSYTRIQGLSLFNFL